VPQEYEPRVKVGFTLRKKHATLLRVLAKYAGVTQGDVLDFLLESAKKDISNVGKKLKETVEIEREKALHDIRDEE
jgi:hypothetical protein